MSPPERVVVAEILRPRGLRGELVARSLTDVAGRFEQLGEANVRLKDGTDLPVAVENAWPHKGDWVLKLAGVDSLNDAERFRGSDLWVRFENRGQLGAGEFFRSDLIGCRVLDAATGGEVGTVEGWQQHGGATPLMEVRSESATRLIPFVASNCRVDLDSRVVAMELPQGLLEL